MRVPPVHPRSSRDPGEPSFPVAVHQLPALEHEEGAYRLRFASQEDDLEIVQRLRFEVFNVELGEGLEEAWASGLDADRFDPVCHHLLVEHRRSGEPVGTYRLQTAAMAARHHGFYSAGEFDLAGLPPAVVERSVELGRACIARRHRNTRVLFLLWKGLAAYVSGNRLRYLFGCCSLTSQDPAEGWAALGLLEREGRLHPEVRVAPRPEHACPRPPAAAGRGEGAGSPPDRDLPLPDGAPGAGRGATFGTGPRRAGAELPILFRTYLRIGALVCGEPAIDRDFRTIDFLVLFDVETLSPRMRRIFFG